MRGIRVIDLRCEAPLGKLMSLSPAIKEREVRVLFNPEDIPLEYVSSILRRRGFKVVNLTAKEGWYEVKALRYS